MAGFFSLCVHVHAHMLHADDVCVIDEIQMLADLERGGAWTRALLGRLCCDSSLLMWCLLIRVTGKGGPCVWSRVCNRTGEANS